MWATLHGATEMHKNESASYLVGESGEQMEWVFYYDLGMDNGGHGESRFSYGDIWTKPWR